MYDFGSRRAVEKNPCPKHTQRLALHAYDQSQTVHISSLRAVVPYWGKRD